MDRKLKYGSSALVLFFLLSSLVFFSLYSTGRRTEDDRAYNIVDQRPRLFGNASEEGIELEWSFSAEDEEVEKFRIFRSLTSSFKELYQEIEESTFEYLDEDVEEGRTYHYWVTARSGEGEESRFSEELKIKAHGENKPLPARNLEAFPGDSKMILRWDEPLDPDVSEIFHYNLYREREGEELSTEKPGKSATEWTEERLENGREYTFRLRAENGEGESEAVKVEATPTADLSPPERPEDLDVFSSDEEVELTWEAPEKSENVLDYRVYRDEKEIAEVEKGTHYFVDQDVTIGEVYNYSISSINVDGEESDRTDIKTVRVEDGVYLFSIKEEVENITEELDDEHISETYRNKYEEENHTLSDEKHISVSVEKEGVRWRLHDEVEGYYHNIRKVDEKLIISEKREESPDHLTLEPGDQEVTISWTASPHEEDEKSRYNIYRGKEENNLVFLTQVEGVSEFTDEDLENGKVYHYRVRPVSSENVLGNATETRHSVPMEIEEEGFPIRTLVAFVVMIGVGVLAIVMILKRREPKGPKPEEEE